VHIKPIHIGKQGILIIKAVTPMNGTESKAAQVRLDQNPDMMRIRRTTVEHPFGTWKAWMGSTHFLTKTIDRVSTEMSLHVMAYNMKRIMNIIGTKPLIEAIGA